MQQTSGNVFEHTVQHEIQSMLGKPYVPPIKRQSKRFVCWYFCREIYALFGQQLQHFHHLQELKRIDTPQVPCIVMFHAVTDWHVGVVWPDGLHFIHAWPINIFDPNPKEYVIRKDRLTAWPFRMAIEGYYVP